MIELETDELTAENFPRLFVVKYGNTGNSFVGEFDPERKFMAEYVLNILMATEGTALNPQAIGSRQDLFPLPLNVQVPRLVDAMTSGGGIIYAFEDKEECDRYVSLMEL